MLSSVTAATHRPLAIELARGRFVFLGLLFLVAVLIVVGLSQPNGSDCAGRERYPAPGARTCAEQLQREIVPPPIPGYPPIPRIGSERTAA